MEITGTWGILSYPSVLGKGGGHCCRGQQRAEPVPQEPTVSHLADLTVPPDNTKSSSSCEKSDGPLGPLGNVVHSQPHGRFPSAPGWLHAKRRLLQFSESRQVPDLRLAVAWPAWAQPPERTWLIPSLVQETPARFWPEVDSGRGAFWEVMCSGTSVGRRAWGDSSALPAPGPGLPAGRLRPASQKLRTRCAFGRFRQVCLL
ncbi:uncharacterized protein [Vicugna pacos]|uniref:Uncharacterized protein n=1 Tax=Vicugna pacos TaxID=30538 RepID=A0ABM5DVM6_VICPA